MPISPYESRYRVRGFDCGYGGPFRPLALANFFQEAAGDHASALGIGMEAMFANRRTWMLSRLDIEVSALPAAGQDVVVRTWPAGTSRLFANRYLQMEDDSGRVLAGALYQYLIVDLDSRRPVRPERILDPGLVCDLPPPFPDLSCGLDAIDGFSLAELAAMPQRISVTASRSHIDHNGHVNNAYLLDWLCEAGAAGTEASPAWAGAPPDDGTRTQPALARLKLDFVAEARRGDSIRGLSLETEDPWMGRGTRTALFRGGDLLARAWVRWATSC
ncbi:MAG TPA: acyl-ACP thioesterase domain-containing protein [Rectinemataceae bacterium]